MLEFLASIANRWRRQRQVVDHEPFDGDGWRPACGTRGRLPDLGDGLGLGGYSPAERALFAHKTFNGG